MGADASAPYGVDGSMGADVSAPYGGTGIETRDARWDMVPLTGGATPGRY